jgi:hypothetical protein
MNTKRILALLVFGALLTFTLSLVNAPQAFAGIKAVVVIQCDPHDDDVEFAHASDGSPVSASTLEAMDCTDAIVFLDQNHFKFKNSLQYGGPVTINEHPASTAGTFDAWHSDYVLIFHQD